MDYLQNGVPVKYFDNGEERSTLVYLIEFKNPSQNDFTVANQWTFIENSEKRPDVILFVNAIHFTHDQFGAKILSTSTNDYKGLPFTEVVVTTTPSKTEDLKNFLKEQKFFYYAAGGQN